MLRRKKSKRNDEVRESSGERLEHGGVHGPTRNGHGTGEYDDAQHDEGPDHEDVDDHFFTEEPHDLLEGITGGTHEGERAFNAAGNDQAPRATEDEVADMVNTIWRQRLNDDSEGALDDLRARVNELGYRLAYSGRTHLAPVAKRTYYIIDPDVRERIDVFHSGDADLTLLEVCLWSELAFKR